MKRIWVVLGQTGSGKSTFAMALSRTLPIQVSVNWTTRPIRPNESKGAYNFVNYGEFTMAEKSGRLIGVRTYNTVINGLDSVYKYAIEKDALDSDEVLVITDWEGYMDIRNIYGDDVVKCLYMYTEPEDLLAQASQREDFNVHEFNRRVRTDTRLTIEEIDKHVTDLPILKLGGTVWERVDTFKQYRLEIQ